MQQQQQQQQQQQNAQLNATTPPPPTTTAKVTAASTTPQPTRNVSDPWKASQSSKKKSILDIQKEQELEPKTKKSIFNDGSNNNNNKNKKKNNDIKKKKFNNNNINNKNSKRKDDSTDYKDPYPRGIFWHLAGKFPRIDFNPECMDYSELNLIMKMQFFPLRSNDVRRDDYYFDEALARHRARLVSGMQPQPLGACEGMGEGLAVVPGLGGRPGGSASKALSAGEKEAVRTLRLKEKATKWQQSNKSLGRFQKSSVRRPRELMDLSTTTSSSNSTSKEEENGGATEEEGEEVKTTNGDDGGKKDDEAGKTTTTTGHDALKNKAAKGKMTVEKSQKVAKGIVHEKCLAAPRWSLRKSIDEGFDSILRLEDLSLALDQGTMTTMTSDDIVASSSTTSKDDNKTTTTTKKKANEGGKKNSTNKKNTKVLTPVLPTEQALLDQRQIALDTLTKVICIVKKKNKNGNDDYHLDVARMKDMVKINKCRKLLCRALQWLDQQKSRVFLIGIMPILQDFIGRGSPEALANATTLRDKKEKWWDSMLDERLSQAICNCIVIAIGGGPNGTQVDPTLPIECLKEFLNRGNKNVKQTLEKRGVSIVIQAIVMHGQTFMQQSQFFGNVNLQQQWVQEYNKFVQIMS